MKKLLLLNTLLLFVSGTTLPHSSERDAHDSEITEAHRQRTQEVADITNLIIFRTQQHIAAGYSQEEIVNTFSPQTLAPLFGISYEDQLPSVQKRWQKNIQSMLQEASDVLFDIFDIYAKNFSLTPEEESHYWHLWLDYSQQHNQAPTGETIICHIKEIIKHRQPTDSKKTQSNQEPEQPLKQPSHSAVQADKKAFTKPLPKEDQKALKKSIAALRNSAYASAAQTEHYKADMAKEQRNRKLKEDIIEWNLNLEKVKYELGRERLHNWRLAVAHNNFVLPKEDPALLADVAQWSRYFRLYKNMTEAQQAAYHDLATTYYNAYNSAQHPTIVHTCMLKYVCLSPEQQQEYDSLSQQGPADSPEFYRALIEKVSATPKQRQHIAQWETHFKTQHHQDPSHQQWLAEMDRIKGRPVDQDQKELEEIQEKTRRFQQAHDESVQAEKDLKESDDHIRANAQARWEAMGEKEHAYNNTLDAKGVIGLVIVTGGVATIIYGTYKCVSLLYRKSVTCYNATTNYIKQKIAKAKNKPSKKTEAIV